MNFKHLAFQCFVGLDDSHPQNTRKNVLAKWPTRLVAFRSPTARITYTPKRGRGETNRGTDFTTLQILKNINNCLKNVLEFQKF